ncbi:hypothetical protein HDU90_001808 [Geranomyces variabilis]|nr:hypothetical protein HDU90_001808 [Geranomyces variabilis]
MDHYTESADLSPADLSPFSASEDSSDDEYRDAPPVEDAATEEPAAGQPSRRQLRLMANKNLADVRNAVVDVASDAFSNSLGIAVDAMLGLSQGFRPEGFWPPPYRDMEGLLNREARHFAHPTDLEDDVDGSELDSAPSVAACGPYLPPMEKSQLQAYPPALLLLRSELDIEMRRRWMENAHLLGATAADGRPIQPAPTSTERKIVVDKAESTVRSLLKTTSHVRRTRIGASNREKVERFHAVFDWDGLLNCAVAAGLPSEVICNARSRMERMHPPDQQQPKKKVAKPHAPAEVTGGRFARKAAQGNRGGYTYRPMREKKSIANDDDEAQGGSMDNEDEDE